MLRRPPLFRDPEPAHRLDAHGPVLASVRAGKIDFHALGRGHYPGASVSVWVTAAVLVNDTTMVTGPGVMPSSP